MALPELTLLPYANPARIIRNAGEWPRASGKPVIAIGNFDGLHRGHRTVIAEAKTLGASLNAPVALLSFEPHPRSFFKPDVPLFRLTPEHMKAVILGRMGVDTMIVLPFDAAMAAMTATEFAEKILFGALDAAGIVVGHDFHFGKGREGSPAFVESMCRQHGRASRIVSPLKDGAEPVSSSAIRAALAEGDVQRANHLLGYRYLFDSDVRHGEKIGRTLGYPTANLKMAENSVLKHGIYAVRASVDGTIYGGVASYGRRPTFDNGAPPFEAYLFDFAGDLYGKTLAVECLDYLRGEEKFASVDDLVVQMHKDADQARAIVTAPADPSAPSLLPV
jgi:riboflavin kinase/FMN adenylyltransferase